MTNEAELPWVDCHLPGDQVACLTTDRGGHRLTAVHTPTGRFKWLAERLSDGKRVRGKATSLAEAQDHAIAAAHREASDE